MSSRAAGLSAIEGALTDEQRTAFLDSFCTANPHYRGAQVADILDMLVDADAHLEITEPIWERFRERGVADEYTRLYAYAAIVLHWIDPHAHATDDQLFAIVAKVIR